MSIGKQFLEEFIQIYRNEVALWQVNNDKYRNKDERYKSLKILLRKTREYEKDATIETVKRKINSLRTSYRREYLKIKRSEKFHAEDYGVHVPTLWYFGHLSFLRDQEIPSDDGNNSKENGSNSTENDPLEWERKVEIEEKPRPAKTPKPTEEDSMLIETPTPSTKKRKIIDENTQDIENSPSPAATIHKITEEELLKLAAEHLENAKKQPVRDEADIFGEGWAMLFRKLDGEQRIYAKRVIDETLMYGQFGQLTFTSSLNIIDGKN